MLKQIVVLGSLPILSGSTLNLPQNERQSDAVAREGAQWEVIYPGGDTRCGFDTPYHFYYRPGTSRSDLVVYFQGGGACWNWVSCSGMFDTTVAEDELKDYRGIFDFSNAANPFQDYTFVFVPYCTGDVHVGDTIGHYGEPQWGAAPVHHRGYVNATAALDWIRANLTGVRKVVVTGASAGSYGALFHAPRVARLFPLADLVYLGDSGVPLLHEYPAILDQWGAARHLESQWVSDGASDSIQVTLEEAHKQIVRVKADAKLAQVTTDADAVQRAFYIFSGSPRAREAAITLLRNIGEAVPTFRAFVITGDAHGLMRVDDFYRYEERGVRLRDWVAELIEGRPVESHYCSGCN